MTPADFDRLAWEPIDAEALAEAIKGSTVTGAEPIDYPLTDGIVIYLTGSGGRQMALEIGADPMTPQDENPFYINLAGGAADGNP